MSAARLGGLRTRPIGIMLYNMKATYRPIESARMRKRDRVAEATALDMAPRVGVEPREGPSRRKNFRLDQAKLDRVKELLGAKSETDAVEQALDLVLFRREVMEGLRRIAGSGVTDDIHARRSSRRT